MVDAVCVQGKKVDLDRARRLAAQFGAELTDKLPEDKDARYFLLDKTGLSFVADGQTLKGDFTRLLPRVTGGHLQHEILLKAAKQDAPDSALRGVDATAGMGEDAFIFAAGGYQMELFEHNPVTAALLADSLIRAKANAQTKEIASRMTLHTGDSKDLLSALSYTPDFIYLDPMFPEKKKSAESKAKLQMLHRLEAPCADEVSLLQAALAAKPRKIIIKRPPGCEFLAGRKPTYSVERKAVRFDCIVLPQE